VHDVWNYPLPCAVEIATLESPTDAVKIWSELMITIVIEAPHAHSGF